MKGGRVKRRKGQVLKKRRKGQVLKYPMFRGMYPLEYLTRFTQRDNRREYVFFID